MPFGLTLHQAARGCSAFCFVAGYTACRRSAKADPV
jgi:hypothetical protein